MFKTSDPTKFKKLLEYIDCFENPQMTLGGELKDNFDALILSDLWPEESSYVTILKALTRESNSQSTMMADNITERMTENSENGKGHPPTAQAYHAAICVWAVSNRYHAASRCCEYLDNLWSLYDKTKDKRFVPLRSSYISTIDALSRSRKGFEGATQAERLLEDMENFSQEHSSLTPNTICFNAVL